MPTRLDRQQLIRLAQLGARVRLSQIQTELAALQTLLGTSEPRRTGPRGARAEAFAGNTVGARPPRRKPHWSAAQRRAVAVRMRAYWAKRRAAAKK